MFTVRDQTLGRGGWHRDDWRPHRAMNALAMVIRLAMSKALVFFSKRSRWHIEVVSSFPAPGPAARQLVARQDDAVAISRIEGRTVVCSDRACWKGVGQYTWPDDIDRTLEGRDRSVLCGDCRTLSYCDGVKSLASRIFDGNSWFHDARWDKAVARWLGAHT